MLSVPVGCTMDQSLLGLERASQFIAHQWNTTATHFCISRITSVIREPAGFVELNLAQLNAALQNETVRNVQVRVIERSKKGVEMINRLCIENNPE